MHRSISATLPTNGSRRPLLTLRRGLAAVFAALALGGSIATLSAQAPDAKDAPVLPQPGKVDGNVASVRALVIDVNVTKSIGMSRPEGATEDPLIAKVHNENPKVIKVQSIIDDPRHISVTGIAAGTTRLTFTSRDGKVEELDVRVPMDDENVRIQQRKDFLKQVSQGVPQSNVDAVVAPNNTVILTGWLKGPEQTQIVVAMARAIWGAQANIVDTMTVARVPQIQIDTTIAVVNRSKVRSAAFSWVMNGRGYFLSSMLSSNSFTNSISNGITSVAPATFAATATAASTPANVAFGIVDPTGGFSGFIQALRTEGLAKVHSEPKIVTLSGKQAQLVSGGETPILTSSGIGSPTVSYKSFGTVVDVLPIVLGDGRISLEVKPSLSSINQANGITLPGGGGTVVPGFDTRGCSVTVQMQDGETLAIGGLIQFIHGGSVAKVPILGDIPFLGAAFSTKSFSETEEELIILITPRLVDPMQCCDLPSRLPTKLTRTPDDFELFLEQLLELPRGPRQVCADGCYTAGYKNGPTASQIPCAGTSCVVPRSGTCANGSCAAGTQAAGAATVGAPTATAAPLKTSVMPTGESPANYVYPAGSASPYGATGSQPASGAGYPGGAAMSRPLETYRLPSDSGAASMAPPAPTLQYGGEQPVVTRPLRP